MSLEISLKQGMVPFEKFWKMFPKTQAKLELDQYIS